MPNNIVDTLRYHRLAPHAPYTQGDLWCYAVAFHDKHPELMTGPSIRMEYYLRAALCLVGTAATPLPRLITLWKNRRWRQLATQWCATALGRDTFRFFTWDWMMATRLHDVCLPSLLLTLLPPVKNKLQAAMMLTRFVCSIGLPLSMEHLPH